MSTWYKYDAYVTKNSSDKFDEIYKPGDETPYSGIYRCMGCDQRIASNVGNPLPPQNHHQHSVT